MTKEQLELLDEYINAKVNLLICGHVDCDHDYIHIVNIDGFFDEHEKAKTKFMESFE